MKKFLAGTAVSLVAVGIALTTALPASAVGEKVTVNPTAVTIAPGSGSSVNLQLTEPIICPGSPCMVTFGPNVAFPTGVSVPLPMIIDAANWDDLQTLPVSITDNANVVPGESFDIELVLDSASEFYDGYVVTITVNVPAEQQQQQQNDDELAHTGLEFPALPLGAVAVAAVGVGFTLRRARL